MHAHQHRTSMQEEGSSEVALLDYSELLSPLQLLHGDVLNHFGDCVCMHTASLLSWSSFPVRHTNHEHLATTHIPTVIDQIALPSVIASRDLTGQV